MFVPKASLKMQDVLTREAHLRRDPPHTGDCQWLGKHNASCRFAMLQALAGLQELVKSFESKKSRTKSQSSVVPVAAACDIIWCPAFDERMRRTV